MINPSSLFEKVDSILYGVKELVLSDKHKLVSSMLLGNRFLVFFAHRELSDWVHIDGAVPMKPSTVINAHQMFEKVPGNSIVISREALLKAVNALDSNDVRISLCQSIFTDPVLGSCDSLIFTEVNHPAQMNAITETDAVAILGPFKAAFYPEIKQLEGSKDAATLPEA